MPSDAELNATDARPAVWKEWADFERQAKALEVESKKLMEIAPSDPAALNAQFRALPNTCGECHEKYRTPGSRKRDF